MRPLHTMERSVRGGQEWLGRDMLQGRCLFTGTFCSGGTGSSVAPKRTAQTLKYHGSPADRSEKCWCGLPPAPRDGLLLWAALCLVPSDSRPSWQAARALSSRAGVPPLGAQPRGSGHLGSRCRLGWWSSAGGPLPPGYMGGLDSAQLAHASVHVSSHLWGSQRRAQGHHRYPRQRRKPTGLEFPSGLGFPRVLLCPSLCPP